MIKQSLIYIYPLKHLYFIRTCLQGYNEVLKRNLDKNISNIQHIYHRHQKFLRPNFGQKNICGLRKSLL